MKPPRDWEHERQLKRMANVAQRGDKPVTPAPPRPPQGSITRKAEANRKRTDADRL